MPIHQPYIPLADIRRAVEALLAEHHPGRSIPVPIEEIVEFGLGIEIRPFRGLRDRFGFEGALARDLKTIIVDEAVMDRHENRYRFTLAHELGHLTLHGALISAAPILDKESWRREVGAVDPQSYAHLEQQAYLFAGLLLVPADLLREVYTEMDAFALERGVDLTEMGEDAISYVADRIGRVFRVSGQVIARRMRAEHLPPSPDRA